MSIMIAQILSHLPEDFPWRDRIHWHDTVESTNTLAKKMASTGAPHGTVILADRQTAGRGRLGRSFHSPRNMGVYMSVILRPKCQPAGIMHLTCAAAVAMCDAVSACTGFLPRIKWTNDLVYQGRKIAGILTELATDRATGDVDYVIVGVGINCNQKIEDFPPDIQGFAGSLSMFADAPVDRSAVVAAMLQSLLQMDAFLLTEKAAVMDAYARNCLTIGSEISILRGDTLDHGTAVGITPDGALLVRMPDGRVEHINSGEVSIRGMYGYL